MRYLFPLPRVYLTNVSWPRDLIHLNTLDPQQVYSFFERVASEPGAFSQKHLGSSALLFFEPSTRTRLSFAAASIAEGYFPLDLGPLEASSLQKGESISDTIENIAAMGPSFMIIRCAGDVPLPALAASLPCPVIAGGWGRFAHPSQALLDLYTVWTEKPHMEQVRFLFVGDLKHSRVVASHLELLSVMGVEIGMLSPRDWEIQDVSVTAKIQKFQNLKQALAWANVVMALRTQTERHGSHSQQKKGASAIEAGNINQLNDNTLKDLEPSAIILHPGPVVWGDELAREVLKDPRCRVVQQVSNGVLVRRELLRIYGGLN